MTHSFITSIAKPRIVEIDKNGTEAILVVVEAETLVLGLGGNGGVIGVHGVGDGVGIRFGVFGLQIFELAFGLHLGRNQLSNPRR